MSLMESHHDESAHEAALDLVLDPEAMLLAALMWAGENNTGADRTCTILTAGDFYNTSYGSIFTAIASRRAQGQSTDPASIQGALHALGSAAPMPISAARTTLLALATLGALPANIMSYADQVLGTSYRRQFHQMALTLAHAAEAAPEEELMDIMVAHGRAQRAAWARRTSFIHPTDSATDVAPPRTVQEQT